MNEYWTIKQSISQIKRPVGQKLCIWNKLERKNKKNNCFQVYSCEKWGVGWWRKQSKSP